MAQLFGERWNLAARTLTISFLLLPVAIALVLYVGNRSAYDTGQHYPVPQPVPFSHAHHVGGLGIDCRYCHTSVAVSSVAGLPPTETCMNCHSQLWTEADMLAPVRESWRRDEPLAWRRVYDVADFVFFDHSMHVLNGIGCETCHGRVDRMPLLWKARPLFMQWCIDCHRDPLPHVRPPDAVYAMGWAPPDSAPMLRARWAEAYGIETERLTDCTTCHR